MRPGKHLSSLLFPRARCLCCNDPRHLVAGQSLCPRCRDALLEMKTSHLCCPRCLSFLNQEKACSFCARGGLSGIERAYAPFIYRDEARMLVLRLKFGPFEEAGPPLAMAIAKAITGQGFDFLVPVPLYRDNLRERGFNQAELLARMLQHHRPELPLLLALEKTSKTRRQSSLGHEERFVNARQKYRTVANVSGKKLLLIDDVRTTGATAQDCARALKEANAHSISLLTATVAA